MPLAQLLKNTTVRNFLQNGEVYEDLVKIARQYHLDEGRIEEFLDLTDAVLDEQIALGDVPMMIAEAFGVGEDVAKKIACDVVGYRLLPLEEYVPGVAEQLVAWGGTREAYPALRIEKDRVSAQDLAERVANIAQLSLSEMLMKRLAFLIEQYGKGEKTEESIRVFFGRPLTIGGMGLTKEESDALLTAVRDNTAGIIIGEPLKRVDPEPTDPELPTEIPVDVSHTPHPTPHTQLIIPPSHEMANTVPVISSPPQAIAREKRAKEGGAPDNVPDAGSKKRAEKARKVSHEGIKTALAEAIALATTKAGPALASSGVSPEVFAQLTEKMLRGLRDPFQTRALLEREYKVRGNDLAVFMSAFLAADESYRVAVVALTHTDEDLTLPETDVAGSAPREVPIARAEPPKKGTVDLTVGSVAPEVRQGATRRVADVVAGKKLMGPVEQLGSVTLGDFRRFSTNPADAIQKLDALLIALQKTSFEERLRGVQAWRKSPLYALYVACMTESLNAGVTMVEISARRRTQGQESLTPGEIQAIERWNDEVRF